MRKSLSLLLPVALAATLSMCTNSTPEPLTVWTSEPQVADYFSWYNATVEGSPIEVQPIERGSGYRLLRSGNESPDLIIDTNLLKADAPARYASLDTIIDGREREFYRPLLAAGRMDEVFHVVPISFDVPGVMFADAWQPPQDERRSIEFSELRDASGSFNETDDDRPVRMGYSPTWQPSFALETVTAFGARFRNGPDDLPLWSRDSIDEALSFMRSWSEELNSGEEAEQDFQDRYLVIPGNRSVQRGRTGFWYTTANDFYSLPEEEIAGLDVRWLSRDDTLAVGDHVRWAVIPSESDQKESARSLLRWFLKPDTQHQLIEASYTDREPVFGLAGGFSSLQNVNTRHLTETHPELTGRVPGESQLTQPVAEHRLWPRLTEQVVVPWLQAAIREETDSPLDEQVRNWLKQQEL